MRKSSAFTLIEVIITIAIISIGIVAVLNMFPVGIEIAGFGQRSTKASYLAQDKLEELIADSYFNLVASITTEDYETIPGFEGYKRVTKVNCVRPSDFSSVDCDYDPAGDPYPMKEVEVGVLWRSSFGGEKQVSLKTMVSRR